MGALPLFPRLRPGSHVIRNGSEAILRYGNVVLRLHDPARADFVLKAIGLMDGRPVADIVRALGVSSLSPLISLLDELSKSKLIADPENELSPTAAPLKPLGRLLPGVPPISIAIMGSGSIASQVYADIINSGMGRPVVVDTRDIDDAGRLNSTSFADGGIGLIKGPDVDPISFLKNKPSSSGIGLLIACADGPDLEALEQVDRAAKAYHFSWVPAFFFGNKAITGPIMTPDSSPCFQCFELRWLGMASYPALERDFFQYIRKGGWRVEQPVAESAGKYIGRMAVNLVVDWLNGSRPQDQVGMTDLGKNETTFYGLRRHPGCADCSKADPRPTSFAIMNDWSQWEREKAGMSPEEFAAGLVSMSDPYIGLIGPETFLNDPANADNAMELFNCTLRYAHPRPDLVCCGEADWSWGHSLDRDEARLLARVEGLERYCGMAVPISHVMAAYKDVSGHAIYPPDLPLFSSRQYSQPEFPYKPFSADEPLAWTWAYDLTNERPRLVPAAAAWYGRYSPLLDESSNGVAAHTTRRMAIYKGALELVEREGIMIFWLNHISPPLIDQAGIKDSLTRHALEDMEKNGYTPYIANITTDLGIPAMLAMAIREDGKGPALLSGAGSALGPAEALDRAIKEVYGHVKTTMRQEWKPKAIKKRMEVNSPDDHYMYYSLPSRLPLAEFMWRGTRMQSLEDLPSLEQGEPVKDLKKIIEVLHAHQLDLIAAELTTPDVAPTGLHVVRAIIPGIQPIYFGINNRRLGGKRLYEVPRLLGYTDGPTAEDRLNPCPHFFP